MDRHNRQETFYHVWPTAWGPIGGVVGPGGLKRLILPHGGCQQVKSQLIGQYPQAKPSAKALAQIAAPSQAYFKGRVVDFDAIECDLSGLSGFAVAVLRACRDIPYGWTLNYSGLASMVRRPRAARAVGSVMSRNPIPLVIPCHRVVCKNGRLGGFSAPAGVELKRRMLELEAAQ